MPIVRADKNRSGEDNKRRFNKQQTATAFVKMYVSGFSDLPSAQQIAIALLDAIKDEQIKPVKNLVIACGVVQHVIMKALSSTDNRVTSYRDVLNLYPDEFKISPQDLAELAPWMTIKTDPSLVRRRRNARERDNGDWVVSKIDVVSAGDE